ncbi:hypothetical protein [Spiroplasma endosymbiont of Colias croceus]|uniref:hypothetical protein n=1 Tax=Spiroplasma endosymbiont of Colias croceus TaxID=3066310 RepID=UPI0030D3DAFB
MSTEEISKLQSIIEEQSNEIQKLKKQIEELNSSKQSNVNLTKFSYNAITIYDEKNIKKTGIEKIHEEILPIEDKIFFITTIQNLDNSINEEVMHFKQFQNGDIEIMKQLKKYENLNQYKKHILLIDKISTNDTNNYQFVSINNFLKQQQDFKLKPTKGEISIWTITILIPIVLITIGLIHPPLFIMRLGFGIVSLGLKGIASIFSPTTKKVETWIKQKINKNKEQKEKNKKERQSIIKNLTSNKTEIKLETRLQTQYDILKQELDNRKDKNHIELISNNTINHNPNNLLENLTIESESNQNFDWFIRNRVNNQDSQPLTTSNHNWNKVKCLFT